MSCGCHVDRELASADHVDSLTAGELMHALVKQASDKFNNLASSILPFVFVGKHDSHDAVKEQFQSTWDEAVGGSRTVLLYLQEILKLSSAHLDSAQWTLKHTAARSVADATVAVCDSASSVSNDAAKLLWPNVEKALGGKTWEGKEVVLAAFVKFVQNTKSWYLKESGVAPAIVKVSFCDGPGRTTVASRANHVGATDRCQGSETPKCHLPASWAQSPSSDCGSSPRCRLVRYCQVCGDTASG